MHSSDRHQIGIEHAPLGQRLHTISSPPSSHIPHRNLIRRKPPKRVLPSIMTGTSWEIRFEWNSRAGGAELRNMEEILARVSNVVRWDTGRGVLHSACTRLKTHPSARECVNGGGGNSGYVLPFLVLMPSPDAVFQWPSPARIAITRPHLEGLPPSAEGLSTLSGRLSPALSAKGHSLWV